MPEIDAISTEVERFFSGNIPFGLMLAEGRVEKHDWIYKFGYSDAIPVDPGAVVWDGAISQAFPDYPSGGQIKVSSTSANDTAAGTGMQTARVYGLNHPTWEPQTEVVTMNGQTEVLTALDYIRVFRAVEETSGSGEENDGTVWFGDGTVTAGVPATKFMAISPGENKTLHAEWSVGTNRKAYIKMLWASSFGNANGHVTIRFRSRPFGGNWHTEDKFKIGRGRVPIDHMIPLPFDQKTDFRVTAFASAGTFDVSAAFEAVTYEYKNG